VAHRIVLVEDNEEACQALAALVDGQSAYALAGVARTADAALQLIETERTDLVLADLVLGSGPDGIQLTTGIKAREPLLPVLMLSGREEVLFAERALLAGCAGYLMKEDVASTLFEALNTAIAGRIWLSRAVRDRLLPPVLLPAGDPAGTTDPFLQAVVAELRLGNRSVVGLARRLSQPQHAVKGALEDLQHRLGLPSRAALYLHVG
jgi:DNA-binding NarL/FixJ family response regulator